MTAVHGANYRRLCYALSPRPADLPVSVLAAWTFDWREISELLLMTIIELDKPVNIERS